MSGSRLSEVCGSEACCPWGPRLPPVPAPPLPGHRGPASAWAAGGRLQGGLVSELARGRCPGGPAAVHAQGALPRPRGGSGVGTSVWRGVQAPGWPLPPPRSLCALVLGGAVYLAEGPAVVRKVPSGVSPWPVWSGQCTVTRARGRSLMLPLGEVGAGVHASFPRPSWEGDPSPRPRAGHKQLPTRARRFHARPPAAPAGLSTVGSGRCEDGPSVSCPLHPRAACLPPPEQLGRTQVPGATAGRVSRVTVGGSGLDRWHVPLSKEGMTPPPP